MDIKAKKMTRKLLSKTYSRKDKSCRPNKNLNRGESDDDSNIECVKLSRSKEEQKLKNNFDNKEYKKGLGKKTTKKTNKGKPKESKSDGDKKNVLGLEKML